MDLTSGPWSRLMFPIELRCSVQRDG
jgi:hypothetical protein